MSWIVDWSVSVGGVDRTQGMRPYLMDISVTDKEGTQGDACSLTFDDSDGRLGLEGDGAPVIVGLAGRQVFSGVIDSIRSSGSRGGGRTLKMTAKGFDVRGKAKEMQEFHKDDASLDDFLGQAAKNAGFRLSLDPAFAGIKRDYWSAGGDSFLSLGQRLARELNGTFKLRGNVAVLVRRGGEQLPAIHGIVGAGGNIISWDISPFTGRGAWRKTKARWFDRKKAKFEEKEVEIDLGRDLPDTINVVRMRAADGEQAEGLIEARKGEAEREGGEGSVELDITPEAQAEAPFILSGARDGVDGTYRIVTVTHKADRSGGATTALELKQPGGGAGKDSRVQKKKKRAAAGDGDEADLPAVPGLS